MRCATSTRLPILRDVFGPDFLTSMIGKTIEVEGESQGAFCRGLRGSIRITLAHQVRPVKTAQFEPGSVAKFVVPPSQPVTPAMLAPTQSDIDRAVAADAARQKQRQKQMDCRSQVLLAHSGDLIPQGVFDKEYSTCLQGPDRPAPAAPNAGRASTPAQPVQQGAKDAASTQPLPPPRPASGRAAPAQAAPTPSVSGIDAIIELVKGGMSEALVIKTIQREARAYNLTPADLLKLQKAGVSEKIIEVMLDPATASTATPATSAAAPTSASPTKAPAQAAAPATTAPNSSAAADARAKAAQDQQDQLARQRATAQEQAKHSAEEVQRKMACAQQLVKDHPDGGRSDPDAFQKAYLACMQLR